jgi:polysaccharide deacetylase family protein (PEP-CTERM system associated)
VRGYRAATYSITGQSLWALDILEELGFEYDSSIFPVRHDLYGIPGCSRRPFRVASGRLVEIPLTTVNVAGQSFPCAGGGYFRLLPYSLFKWALHRVNQRDQMAAVFYCHPWEIDPHQPRIDGLPFKSRFRHYTNLDATEARLEKLLTDFSWGRMDEAFGLTASARAAA